MGRSCFALCKAEKRSHGGAGKRSLSSSGGGMMRTPLVGKTSSAEEVASGGGGIIKRIKVVITKQQFEELLSKQVSLEDIVTSGIDSPLHPSSPWRPQLDTIVEE